MKIPESAENNITIDPSELGEDLYTNGHTCPPNHSARRPQRADIAITSVYLGLDRVVHLSVFEFGVFCRLGSLRVVELHDYFVRFFISSHF